MKCRYRNAECIRPAGDCPYCSVVDMHLCDTCEQAFPECSGKNIKFGCDIDTEPRTRQKMDNVFCCDGYIKQEKKMQTNADCIRAMNDEELAKFLVNFKNTFGEEYEGEMSCLEWLQSETEG